MKLLKSRYLYTLFIATCWLLYGCDTIPPDQAWEVRPTPPIDTSQNDTLKLTPVQRVFLEDFTGHRCGNCPAAAREITRLEGIHGDKLIAMAIHCSDLFAAPLPPQAGKFTYDFRTAVGNLLDQKFGASNAGLPKGMVNRRRINNAYIMNFSAWGGVVSQVLAETPKAGLYIKGNFDNNTRQLNLTIDGEILESQSTNFEIVTYLVEDSIINWQKDYERPAGQQDIPDYVHRHVLRAQIPVNDAILRAPIPANTRFRKFAGMTVANEYNTKHLAAIVLLINTATEEVLQVAEFKLKRIL